MVRITSFLLQALIIGAILVFYVAYCYDMAVDMGISRKWAWLAPLVPVIVIDLAFLWVLKTQKRFEESHKRGVA